MIKLLAQVGAGACVRHRPVRPFGSSSINSSTRWGGRAKMTGSIPALSPELATYSEQFAARVMIERAQNSWATSRGPSYLRWISDHSSRGRKVVRRNKHRTRFAGVLCRGCCRNNHHASCPIKNRKASNHPSKSRAKTQLE